MRDDVFAPAATPGDPGGTGGALPLPRSRRGTFLRRSAGIVLGTAIALVMLFTLGLPGFLLTHLTRPSSLGTATYTTTTPTATPGQSAPGVQASSATVTVTQASETEKGPATLSACPSGCVVKAITGSASQQLSHVSAASGGYWAVDLRVTSQNGQSCSGCVVNIQGFNGSVTIGCDNNPLDIFFNAGQTVWYQCTLPANEAPVGTFNGFFGNGSGPPSATYYNPSSSYWVPMITSADCQRAEGGAIQAAQDWLNAYPLPGDSIVTLKTHIAGESCNPAPGTYAATTTGYATGHVDSYEVYKSSDAQAAALAALNATVSSPWTMKSGTLMACSPTWDNLSGVNFTISCQDDAVFLYAWSSAHVQSLAGVLVSCNGGTCPVATANSICAGYPGVASGGCAINVAGGDGQTMPGFAANVAIQVNGG
jgi:hypothetical protein